MNAYFALLPILSVVLCIGAGFFTLSRNLGNPANIGFALGMASLATVEAGSSMILLSSGVGRLELLGVRVFLIGEALLPAAWLLFSLVFSRAGYRKILSKNALLISSVIFLSLLFVVWSAVSANPSKFMAPADTEWGLEGDFLAITGAPGKYFFIYLILGLVLNLVQLENTLRSSTGVKRWQIKYIIFGVGSMLAFHIYVSSQALLFSGLTLQTLPLISSVTLISVSIITVFIVKYKLMNVDIFISRYVVYNSLTVIIVGLYLLAMGVVAYGIRYLNIPFNYFFTTLFIFVAIFALFVLLFTAGSRKKAQLFINRHFYKHKYEFRDKWMETIEKVSSRRSEADVERTLSEMVSETMGVKDIHLWIQDPVSKDYLLRGDGGKAAGLGRIKQGHPLLLQMAKTMGPFTIGSLKVQEGQEAVYMDGLTAATGAELCAPLAAGREIIGFMLLGKDTASGESYRQDDFDILRAMTSQAAVQITSIRLSEHLMDIKELEAFSNMSSFIMHDLKNLTNSLSLVSQNAKHNMDNTEFQRDAVRTIESIVLRMKGLIGRLSSVPGGIEIRRDPTDLRDLINGAIRKVPADSSKDIVVLNEVGSLPPLSIDPEAMDMVFLNLLTNACDAVEKQGTITVSASLNKGAVDITVSDNGCGMSKDFVETALFRPFKTKKKNGFGIGLFQCKAIVEAHGGRIEVESNEYTGTTFRISLPSTESTDIPEGAPPTVKRGL